MSQHFVLVYSDEHFCLNSQKKSCDSPAKRYIAVIIGFILTPVCDTDVHRQCLCVSSRNFCQPGPFIRLIHTNTSWTLVAGQLQVLAGYHVSAH